MKSSKLFSNKSTRVLLKNISYLASGQIIAQLISLLGAFFIPRLLGPENYGEYQVIINYVLMYKLLTFTGVNKINIREIAKDVNKLSEIINNSIVLRLVFAAVSVFISLVVLMFLNYSETIVFGIVLFSLFLLLFSINNTITTVFYSIKKLEYISYLTIIQSVGQVLLSISALLLGYGVLSLVIIYLLVELVAIIIGAKFVFRYTNYRPKLMKKIDYSLIKKGYKFSIIDFFNLLSSKIDIVMLSFLTDPGGVGVYALANLLARKGLIVRRAIAQSIFPYYSEYKREHLTFKSLNKHFFLILTPSIPIIIVIFFGSDFIVQLIAGDAYIESGKILKVLVFYLAFHYAVLPFSSAIESQYMEKLTMYIGFFRAMANVILNFVLFQYFGIIGIAYSTLVVWSLNFVIHYVIAFKQFTT